MGEGVEGFGVMERIGHSVVLRKFGLALALAMLALFLLVFFLLLDSCFLGLLLKLAVLLLKGLSFLDVLEDYVVTFQLEARGELYVKNSRLVGVGVDADVVIFILARFEGWQTKLLDWLLAPDLGRGGGLGGGQFWRR